MSRRFAFIAVAAAAPGLAALNGPSAEPAAARSFDADFSATAGADWGGDPCAQVRVSAAIVGLDDTYLDLDGGAVPTVDEAVAGEPDPGLWPDLP